MALLLAVVFIVFVGVAAGSVMQLYGAGLYSIEVVVVFV